MAEEQLTSLDKLLGQGKELGFTGDNLSRFVESQQKLERDDRAERRESRAEALKMETLLREKDIELEKLRLESLSVSSASSNGDRSRNYAPRPKLPKFCDESDSIDAYISRFEIFATNQSWPADEWASILSALLSGKALQIFSTLPADHQTDFARLKGALLKGYDLTEDGFLKKFRQARVQTGETYLQFGGRLDHYFSKWVELSEVAEDFGGLKELVFREQFLAGCSPELTIHLKERKLRSSSDLLEAAEIYREARADSKPPKFGIGHKNPRNFQNKGNGELPVREERTAHSGQPPRGQEIGRKPFGKPTCFNCNKLGHFAKDCRWKPQRLAALLETPLQARAGEHGRGGIEEFAGTCSWADASLPTQPGTMGGKQVQVLRDTGCSTGVVRATLVDENQQTGETATCTLIDGTTRQFPVAEVDVDTPFYKGKLRALVMQDPLYDVIIGNLPGARSPDDPDLPPAPVAAVETRAQAEEKSKGNKPLRTPPRKPGLDASTQDIREGQKADESLKKLWETSRDATPQDVRGGTVSIQLVKGLLHRVYTNGKTGKVTSQLVVPREFRETVMSVGHDALMAGHMGQGKTADRIMASFYWPGVSADIKRFCASCDSCQRTSPKGKTKKAFLQTTPLIDTPFHRVAIDLVGPIAPVSSSGKRYILTLVDYATRYPEAVALKAIDTVTIAEALVEMFSRVGVPSEILSDRGTQFTSELMAEVSRLLGVKQLHTTPYHPQANGLVERFNGTLKSMLKKMCEEKPKDWDRYIPAVLFAYREAPQASLGFAPFELLYGRTVRGPIAILKELWTSEGQEEEVKSTYQYVVDLRNRLEDTCRFAQETLQQSSQVYKRHFDKKAKDRQLQVDDKVLLLLPTDHNKLLMHWKGPFQVVGKVGRYDYRIKLKEKEKLFHINMLKKYEERENQQAGAAVIDVGDQDPEREGEIVIPEFNTGESLRDIKLGPELDAEMKAEAEALCEEFRDTLTEVPGQSVFETCNIELTSKEPVRVKGYPLPYSTKTIIDQEVKTMLQMGVIEPSRSPYCAPVVIVRKKGGEHRFCVDYRRLNNVTKTDGEVMPVSEDLYTQVAQGKNKFFTKIDLSKGYWQIALTDSSKEMTAFATSTGAYQFTVMPFGLVNAPAVFTRMMRKLLDGIHGVVNFMDDILVASETWKEHVATLKDVFGRLRGANLTAKPSKCHIGFQDLDFLGFVISGDSKKPEQQKVKKMLDAPRPKTKKEIRSLLGLIGFYREFVPNFAAITSPLSDMIKKGQPNEVEWTDAAETALDTVKKRLASYPILKLPDLSKTFILRTDASGVGLGAVLLQEFDGVKFPVRYASRKLSSCELNYATIEKECLAAVWGVQKFQKYLYGQEFILETDHQPLQYLQKAQMKNSRVLRWAMTLQPYRYHVRYIPGRENVGADYLSRVCGDDL